MCVLSPCAVAHVTCDELVRLGVSQVDEIDETPQAALEVSTKLRSAPIGEKRVCVRSANSGDLLAAPHVCEARAIALEHRHVHLCVSIVGSEQPWSVALDPIRPKARLRGGAPWRRH